MDAAIDHLPGLLPHHLAHLRESGLTDLTIRAAGIYSETSPTKLVALLNRRKPFKGLAPAIVIPFHGADGRNGYARVRPDTPRKEKAKPVKYESPIGQPNQVYYPPAVDKVLADPTIELCLTEGEKKALAVTQFGPPCIGLVGVYGWKTKGREQLLPEMERIEWAGRRVAIIFDSDIDRKPDVQAAEAKLAKHLSDRGAIVRCVRLPDGPAGDDGQPTKLGADDFLVAYGPAAFAKVMAEAIEPPAVEGAEGKERAERIEPATMASTFLASREIDGLNCLRFHRGSYWLWHHGRYIELENSEVRAELILKINRGYSFLTTSILANIMAQVQAQAALPSIIEAPAWIGPPPADWPAREVLATCGELVHIPSLVAGTNFMVPATPKLFSTTALDFRFSLDAPKPQLWLDFLGQLWGDDAESVATLQEWFGYLLTLDTRQQKVAMLIGPPRSGKGTIARVLENLIGRANVAGPTLASFETNFGLAALLGKSLAIIADARLSGRVDQSKVVERILSISGEDSLTVDRKHREPVTGKIPARLMIISNELPRLAESSGALAHRMIVLRLTRTFLGKEDTTLTDKLKADLPGILLWAIAGWKRLNDRGHFVQPEAGRELAGEMKDLSSPIGLFLRECCVVGPQYQSAVVDLFTAWGEWCRANGRDHTGTQQTFGRDLRAVVPDIKVAQRRDGNTVIRVYEGISVST